MRTIRGKNALVTGAASGIGRAIALRLAAEGANVVAIDIDQFGLVELVSELKRSGVQAMGQACDISQPNQIADTMARVLNQWETIDILVNNAGVTWYGEFFHMSQKNCEQLVDVNLRAPIEFIRLLMPYFMKYRDAHVVNVASVFGMVGYPQLGVYCATKHAIIGLTESLRGEFARRGIGFTAVCPGFVDTGLFENSNHGADRKTPRQPPRWMMATPERVAERTIKAIYRNRPVEYVQTYARLAPIAKRLCYGLIDRLYRFSKRRMPVVRHFVKHPSATERQRRAA